MIRIYRILINIVYFFSPIIILIRILNKKEDRIRFKEKLCFISKKRPKGKLVWFHASSVGEVLSIIPLIEKLEKKKNINKILITTNTLSSSKVILEKKNLKKVIHQFLPIDTNSLSRKFLNHWKPDIAMFVESEIWPNFIFNIKDLEIPLLLINGRFTKKTFGSWKKIPNSAINIFNMFDLCFVQNQESKQFLKYFKVKKISDCGNLKYSTSSNKILESRKNFSKIFFNNKIWCASSTHFNEEEICAQIHVQLKKKINNLITIIIPRHINRIPKIMEKLKSMNLSVHKHSDNLIKKNKIDIYLVDVYGATLNFYKIAQTVFLGGSLIPHGGQNPLEPARLGCKIFHGPNIQNFKEVYKLLNSLNITETIKNKSQLIKKININLKKPFRKSINKKKLETIGKKILDKTFLEISKFL